MHLSDFHQPQWYCLKSRPQHEHIATAHLRRTQGVEAFCPRLRFTRVTSRGARWLQEAMFTGYLFARFSFVERHKEVRYAMGVAAILDFGGRYAALHESVIEDLRSRANPEEIAIVLTELREGDSVKIAEGALGGLDAVVTNVLSGEEGVRILLNFLGREIQAEVSAPRVFPPARHPLAA
jgi:transcriptional antiterminator RfaH